MTGLIEGIEAGRINGEEDAVIGTLTEVVAVVVPEAPTVPGRQTIVSSLPEQLVSCQMFLR